MPEPAAGPHAETFRLALVPGVTPAKWIGVWRERLPDVALELVPVDALDRGDVLREGRADAGLVRLPIDRDGLAAIPLYTEVSVVVVPKDHVVAAFDQVTAEELADEVVLHPLDDPLEWDALPGLRALERPATTADAIELVAAGVGVLVVPQSVARLHHRRDLTYRQVTDGPGSQVALAWVEERTTDLVEELVGIVRGRTARSSRGRVPAEEIAAAQAAEAAKEKAKAAADARRATPAKAGPRVHQPRRSTISRAKSPGRRGGSGRGSR